MIPSLRAFVSLFVVVPIFASQIAPLDLARLREQSTLVVVGYVVDAKTAQQNRGFAERVATVRVVEVLRGTLAARTLTVRTRTGLVFFDRHLQRGDAGVLFLKPSERGGFEAACPASFALFGEGTVEEP